MEREQTTEDLTGFVGVGEGDGERIVLEYPRCFSCQGVRGSESKRFEFQKEFLPPWGVVERGCREVGAIGAAVSVVPSGARNPFQKNIRLPGHICWEQASARLRDAFVCAVGVRLGDLVDDLLKNGFSDESAGQASGTNQMRFKRGGISSFELSQKQLVPKAPSSQSVELDQVASVGILILSWRTDSEPFEKECDGVLEQRSKFFQGRQDFGRFGKYVRPWSAIRWEVAVPVADGSDAVVCRIESGSVSGGAFLEGAAACSIQGMMMDDRAMSWAFVIAFDEGVHCCKNVCEGGGRRAFFLILV